MRLTKDRAPFLVGLALCVSLVAGRLNPEDVDRPNFEFPSLAQPSGKFKYRCPALCAESGPTPFTWSSLHSIKALNRCNETVLFDTSAAFPIESSERHTSIRACAAPNTTQDDGNYGPPCASKAKLQSAQVNLKAGSLKEGVKTLVTSPVVLAAEQLEQNLLLNPTCDQTALFARSGDAVVGLFVGAEIRKSSAATLVRQFIDNVQANKSTTIPAHFAAEMCGPKGKRSSAHTFGIISDTTGDIKGVHETMQDWMNAKCISQLHEAKTWDTREIKIIPALALTMGPGHSLNSTLSLNGTANATVNDSLSMASSSRKNNRVRSHLLAHSSRGRLPIKGTHGPELEKRAECKAVQVGSGADSCYALATESCGISMTKFVGINGGGSDDFCSSLQVGQWLCCTKGDLPDKESRQTEDDSCEYIKVNKGDGCWSLANTRCGIDTDDLYEFNGEGSDEFCNHLKAGQPICCTKGDKPDLRPQKGDDGSCATYTIGKGDLCFDIQEKFYLKDGDLDDFNKGKTWGWAGCGMLLEHQRICLSQGDPPMPASIEDAVCGPQVPGTERPTNDTKIQDLNPCPLNVCCNIWGNCGTTEEFCIDTSIDDTPGTAEKDTFGCISGCGMDIVNNDEGPSSFGRIAYFEGWNQERKCLNMDVTEVGDPATRIHFAFGWISDDFTVSDQGVEDQFAKFKKMDGVKRIISFGGWAFSNDAATGYIMREAIKPANAMTFAQNVVAFVKDNDLDGVDFDWEYPGADDIDGSQPGTPEDGPNYLAFLKLVKRRLPSDCSLSIAAPASYWYLRNFPIKDMSKVIDYIVYMTYDLHGQWDVGNEYAAQGCEDGNCLRSHVNKTETINSLAMITKAGVPAKMIYVGISSYGRSFKMADPGCSGPECVYLGERNQSPAKPGYCTGEGGYIAQAEILEIRAEADQGLGGLYRQWYDEKSASDITVYDGDQWVSWMDKQTKEERVDWIKELNFAGASDWAVDLQGEGEGSDDDDDDIGGITPIDLDPKCKLDQEFDSLDDLIDDSDGMVANCVAMHAINIFKKMLDSALDGYEDASQGYDGLFDWYEKYIKETLDSRLREFMIYSDEQEGAKYFKCYADRGYTTAHRDDAHEVDCTDLPAGYMDDWTYWWELDDEDGFTDALLEAGIDADWIEYGLWDNTIECQDTVGHGACLDTFRIHRGFPKGKDEIEVPNPKDVAEDAYDNMDGIKSAYDAMYLEIGFQNWDGSAEDVVQVLSVPMSMLSSAVDSMESVKKIGKEFKEEDEKNLILQIVEGILFLIPFVGGVAGTLGKLGARLARLLSKVEGIASSGLAIYSIVEDPELAPVAIMGMLLGGLGSGTKAEYRSLARGKGKMTKDQKSALGTHFEETDPKVQKLVTKSCML